MSLPRNASAALWRHFNELGPCMTLSGTVHGGSSRDLGGIGGSPSLPLALSEWKPVVRNAQMLK